VAGIRRWPAGLSENRERDRSIGSFSREIGRSAIAVSRARGTSRAMENGWNVMRVARVVAGFGLLGCGIVMLALPGPGALTIAAALAILSAEYDWARCALEGLKQTATQCADRLKGATGYGSRVAETNRSSRQ
jgi:putative transmembrane protein PGPGW